jgi:predicted GH43/DUF377 family glycosyl hydrolase
MKADVYQYWGHDRILITETDTSFKPTGRCFQFSDGQDARLFRADDRIWVAFCRAWRQWLLPLGVDHHFERCGEALVPNFKRNQYVLGPAEKNWTWIDSTPDSIDCIYRWEPFMALRFDDQGCCIENFGNNRVILPWSYGKINGGTPSVLLPSGDRFSVFHSHLGDPRTYYMGGIYHKAYWPYEPIKVLRKPLMIGTGRFKRWPLMDTGQRCNAVFPCGLAAEKDRLLVSYGVDDCACAVAEFTYEELKDYDTAA